MSEVFLIAKNLGPYGIVVLICMIGFFKMKDKVDKSECSKNRAELYEENKKILQAINDQKAVNEREFGEIQTALKFISRSVNKINGG